MELTVSRRRADELQAALAADRTVHEDAALARELATVAMLREVGAATAAGPSEDFRAALRTRLMAVAAVQGVGGTAAAPSVRRTSAVSWRHRAATVTAGVMAAVVAAAGVSVAASRSLPGDPFYGLKRTTETVQLRLADGAEEQGNRHLQFAGARMRELRQLALGRDLSGRSTLSAADAGTVTDLLDDMDDQTRDGQRLLTEAFRSTRDAAPLERLAAFAEGQHEELREVLPQLPQVVRPRARSSLALVVDVRAAAGELLMLQDCSTACDPAESAPLLADPLAPPSPAASEPCACPTPPPPPAVAPVPPVPASPGPSASAPDSPPASQSPSPSSSPSPTASPSPSPTQGPLPVEPVPLPTLPGEPLPTLPGLEPGGTVRLPPLSDVGQVLAGVLPAVTPTGGLAGTVLLVLTTRWRG